MKQGLHAFLSFLLLITLTSCGAEKISANSTGMWEKFVWFFASLIKFLSFGGSMGIGIILLTLIIKTLLFPLMVFQIKSTKKMQIIQPEIKKIQQKYPGKDMESRRLQSEEIQRVYSENDINMYAGCLPVLAQMPFLWALFQSISKVEEIHSGRFLWFDLGKADPYYILPVLAAIFTFITSWLSVKAAPPEQNTMTKSMTYIIPVMIFFMALNMFSGVALYWVIQNIYQTIQTLLINNPFKFEKERISKLQAERDLEKAKLKALKKALKKK
ncbi:MAG: YidC/Oxa1 family membrane protein insertase [Lactobacillales bacterium]|nr:YidC/Oxa1 family membrane protein insertase [Lactobacillales bacterium]